MDKVAERIKEQEQRKFYKHLLKEEAKLKDQEDLIQEERMKSKLMQED